MRSSTTQKQSPFHVKRTKMKDSIIRCRQIIDNFQQMSGKLKRQKYKMDIIVQRKKSLKKKDYKRYDKQYQNSISNNCGGISQYDLLNNRMGSLSNAEIRQMIRIFKGRKSKQLKTQMVDNGMAICKLIQPDYISQQKKKMKTDSSIDKRRESDQRTVPTKVTDRVLVMGQIKRFQEEKKRKDKTLAVASIRPSLTMSNQLPSVRSQKRIKQLSESGIDSASLMKLKKRILPTQRSQKSNKKKYLYEKLQLITHGDKQYTNPIYERRMKSYCDFLWKIMLAHNIYINLDLHPVNSIKIKQKVFIGAGNNCNMISGLFKRRFWWTIVDQYSQDCQLIWTQIKINKIFMIQESAQINVNRPVDKQCKNQQKKLKKDLHGRLSILKKQLKQLLSEYSSHKKIWNDKDYTLMQDYIIKNQLAFKNDEGDSILSSKQQHFQAKTKIISNTIKQIKTIEEPQLISQTAETQRSSTDKYYKVKPIIHNHLQNNYHLGNKKALFYNLTEYYKKIGENPFDYIPLTFHIKNGIKDSEYKRFVKYYEERKNIIKKQEQSGHPKTRNIWIVKPGENTNRGRGITVIDQIYELNNIIKKKQTKKCLTSTQSISNSPNYKNTKTYIVQMYIDRPFLYYDRKFDIRHFMLITNLFGVTRAYWYDEGYIRTSSYLFDVHNFDPQIHLTNDAVQKSYEDYGRFQPFNKISYSQFQSYLNTFVEKKYNFRNQILPKMKKIATDSVKSVYLKANPNQQMHNFQIFGLDFMIDRNFKPWLIQINTNPCLDCNCPLLNRIVPYMVEQSLKLSVDIVYPPPSHYPNSCKHYTPLVNLDTFKYELIFDSLTEGQQLLEKISKNPQENSTFFSTDVQIGEVGEDQVFKDNGTEIKLQDFT